MLYCHSIVLYCTGKPFGWITSSADREPDVNFTHIAFPVELATGRVSVTYLSSYENAGVMELWVSQQGRGGVVWLPGSAWTICYIIVFLSCIRICMVGVYV